MEKRLLILLLISYVKCQYEMQRKPERCYGTTELLYRQCCIFPPFFKREIAKMCGAKFAVTFVNSNVNVTGLRRHTNLPCEHWECMLEKYGLLNTDGKLDEFKYFSHLDKWVGLNPEFNNVMIKAKRHCQQLYRLFLPLKPCEFMHLHSCIRNFINVNCPKLIPSEECNELKLFYEECREYYIS